MELMNTWFIVCIVASCVLWPLDRWILLSADTFLFVYCNLLIDEYYNLETLAALLALNLFVYCDLLIDEPCEHLVHCLHCCFLCIVTSDRWQKQHRRRSLPYWSPSHHTWNLSKKKIKYLQILLQIFFQLPILITVNICWHKITIVPDVEFFKYFTLVYLPTLMKHISQLIEITPLLIIIAPDTEFVKSFTQAALVLIISTLDEI